MVSEIRVDKIHNEGGDNDSGLDMSTNDVVAVKVAGSEKMRVHSDGNVGVGVSPTTSYGNAVQIHDTGTSGANLRLTDSTSGSGTSNGFEIIQIGVDDYLINRENGSMIFYTNNDEKMRIQSSNIKLAAQTFQDGVNVAGDYAFKVFNDGNNANRYGLLVQCGADDASGTNTAVGISDGDGNSIGSINFSGGTVTYAAFTAVHNCSLPDADKVNGYPYGTLLEVTDIYYAQKDGSDTERGIRYVVQKTSSQYSRKVLGSYSGKITNTTMVDQSGTYANNLHDVQILGDGHIICNNSGGNIKVGDGICASATAGIGQKADKLCMIMGIAQKDITFSGSETVLVPVQYGLQQFTPWTD